MLVLLFKQKGGRFSAASWCLQFLLSLLENDFSFSPSDCLEKKPVGVQVSSDASVFIWASNWD